MSISSADPSTRLASAKLNPALAMAESAAGRHEEAIKHARDARRNATVQGHRAVLMKAITC